MARHSNRINVDWQTPSDPFKWDHVAIEVLMDIRSELQQLRAAVAMTRSDIRRIDRRLQMNGALLRKRKA